MDYKDLYPKLDKVLDGISQEDLCQFAKAYAMSNKDMALALVERFWQPDGEDYREIVDACFVHPFVVSTKFGESLDWNAVTEDVVGLMQKIREDKDGKDIIGAAQRALYLIGAFVVLAVAYVLFKKKYYHLHEEYLASLKQ